MPWSTSQARVTERLFCGIWWSPCLAPWAYLQPSKRGRESSCQRKRRCAPEEGRHRGPPWCDHHPDQHLGTGRTSLGPVTRPGISILSRTRHSRSPTCSPSVRQLSTCRSLPLVQGNLPWSEMATRNSRYERVARTPGPVCRGGRNTLDILDSKTLVHGGRLRCANRSQRRFSCRSGV